MPETSTSPPSACAGHACPDVHRDPCDLPVGELDLARVESRADVEAEGTHRLDDRLRAPYARAGPVECREEPVARCVDLAAIEARELAADGRVVLFDEIAPAPIAELGGLLASTRRDP